MVTIYPLSLISEESLIIVPARAENYPVNMVIDTGATHSVIDLNTLLILGHLPAQDDTHFEFETAGGVLSATKFRISSLEIFDRTFRNVEIFTYDFLSLGLIGGYDGVIGLDVLKLFSIHFDFPNNQIKLL